MLSYNENKVKLGVAECIHENLYGVSIKGLMLHDKLRVLVGYTERNRRAVSNAVHISLNFHPDEVIDADKSRAIADAYMEKIGFANQPYLVYRHDDAAHPHLHIVTTNIRLDGKRIIMFNIGRNQSEKARQEIEKDFNLITAVGRRIGGTREHAASAMSMASKAGGDARRAVYGKTETRRAIANAITRALGYKFTSLAEFNAVLKQFNVVAETGREGSIVHAKRGLLFFTLNKDGNRVGVPIKASSFHHKPTLSVLEKLYKRNEALRLPYKDRVRQCIQMCLDKSGKTPTGKFLRAMNREQIFVLFRSSPEGMIYGITFVDNKNKVVFNGSDLGKSYSAKAITELLSTTPVWIDYANQRALESDFQHGFGELVPDLTRAQRYGSEYDPYRVRRKRKKRKLSR